MIDSPFHPLQAPTGMHGVSIIGRNYFMSITSAASLPFVSLPSILLPFIPILLPPLISINQQKENSLASLSAFLRKGHCGISSVRHHRERRKHSASPTSPVHIVHLLAPILLLHRFCCWENMRCRQSSDSTPRTNCSHAFRLPHHICRLALARIKTAFGYYPLGSNSTMGINTLSLGSRTGHFTIPTSLPRRVISLQDPCLRLVCLREGITTLFAHTLDLANFSDSLLKLFHSKLGKVSLAYTTFGVV